MWHHHPAGVSAFAGRCGPQHKHCSKNRPAAPAAQAANDPNGPLFWRGRYHLFYQHVPSTTKWGWGLCWGHASSSDLVYWQHHPPALRPTPGGFDADGCFSGCAVVVPRQQVQEAAPGLACAAHTQQQQQQQDQPEERHGSSGCPGIPVLLYMGVVRRPDAPAGLHPSSLAVSELCHEQQLAAVAADPGEIPVLGCRVGWAHRVSCAGQQSCRSLPAHGSDRF